MGVDKMGTGLITGALVSLGFAWIGQLRRGRLLASVFLGSLSCAAVLQLTAGLRLPSPETPFGENFLRWVQHLIDLQWMAWWILGGSLLPVCLTFILGLTRSLSPLILGGFSGIGAGLLALCWMDYSPAPMMTGILWRAALGFQAIIYLGCALATAGIQRLRHPPDP
jgi:hypothetical protein